MVVTHATVLAYGGLQSEVSSRLTFPTLTNYRLVTVHGFRRVFAHPHFFLCGSGLVDPLKSKEAGSLSVERATGSSFVAAAFDVDMDASERAAFEEREIEYQIREIPFHSLGESSDAAPEGEGLLCLANTNEGLTVDMRATPWVQSLPQGWGVWSWPYDSGLLPAQMYLRHCLLAVKKAGAIAERSFREDTLLCDRRSTLASYLQAHEEEVMAVRPPPELAVRFGG